MILHVFDSQQMFISCKFSAITEGGKSGVGIKMIKMDNFQYFSIKSYVVNVY